MMTDVSLGHDSRAAVVVVVVVVMCSSFFCSTLGHLLHSHPVINIICVLI